MVSPQIMAPPSPSSTSPAPPPEAEHMPRATICGTLLFACPRARGRAGQKHSRARLPRKSEVVRAMVVGASAPQKHLPLSVAAGHKCRKYSWSSRRTEREN
ncbi:unnamed protein product, partial [Prorocentrum cordatum]